MVEVRPYGASVGVCEWISNLILYIIGHVIIHHMLGLKLIGVNKIAPGVHHSYEKQPWRIWVYKSHGSTKSSYYTKTFVYSLYV